MYSEQNEHCWECRCPSCNLFQTDECLEGKEFCERCENKTHTGYCPWHPEEQ